MSFVEDKIEYQNIKNILDKQYNSNTLSKEALSFLIKKLTHSKKWYFIYKHVYRIIYMILIIQSIFFLYNISQFIYSQNYKSLIINISIIIILYIFKDYTKVKREIYDNRYILYFIEYNKILEDDKKNVE